MKITNSLVGQKSQSRVQMLPGLRFLYRAGASKSTPPPTPNAKAWYEATLEETKDSRTSLLFFRA